MILLEPALSVNHATRPLSVSSCVFHAQWSSDLIHARWSSGMIHAHGTVGGVRTRAFYSGWGSNPRLLQWLGFEPAPCTIIKNMRIKFAGTQSWPDPQKPSILGGSGGVSDGSPGGVQWIPRGSPGSPAGIPFSSVLTHGSTFHNNDCNSLLP